MHNEDLRIKKIIHILRKRYGYKHKKSDPYRSLVTTILSQRTKDETTAVAAKRLFDVVKTPREMVKLPEKTIAKLIYPVGFYEQKAKNIKKTSRILLEKYNGKVPDDRKVLIELPGVGGKTADCVLCFAFGRDVVPVDVHVAVISQRLGLTKQKHPEKIRDDLGKTIPSGLKKVVNYLFVEFGKEICQTRLPKCYICPIEKLCPYEKKNLKIV
jgi:endonuclease-3